MLTFFTLPVPMPLVTFQTKLRDLRAKHNLKQSDLAEKSGISRATIINAEDEREQVKFRTVAEIVRSLGYSDSSPEMREIALLWLESVSGIRFSTDDAYSEFKRMLERDEVKLQDLLKALTAAIVENALTPNQVELLCWAATKSSALEILSYAKQLETFREYPAHPQEGLPASGPQPDFATGKGTTDPFGSVVDKEGERRSQLKRDANSS